MEYDTSVDSWKKVLKNGKSEREDKVIYNVDKGIWEKITFVGDSGAVDHVINKDTANGFKTYDTPASRAGIGFRAANNSVIKNYGQKKLSGITDRNDEFRMSVNVTDCKRNLASFNKMVEDGNDIVLSNKGSFIKHIKSGKVINLRMDKGTPEFDVWVQKGFPERRNMGRFGVLNVNGEADIVDKESNVFQRLEMNI